MLTPNLAGIENCNPCWPTDGVWSRGGGYSLCDGWYICAAVLTPFFHFGRIEHDLFGVFFSSTNSKAIFWGTKTTNFYKNRSFWPQIQFFPRSFWVQFSAASGTPPSVFRPSTPPPPPPPPGVWYFFHFICIAINNEFLNSQGQASKVTFM